MISFQQWMPMFDGENLEIQNNPELQNDQRLHIFVTS